jgi:LemA protein
MLLFAELSTGLIALLAVAGVAVLILFWFIGIYNSLVGLRNRYKNAFAQIDVQLKRRNDLIPNLVEVAKGYMKHERETLEAVIAARNKAVTAGQAASSSPGDPAAMQNLAQAEAQVSGALSRMFALAEAYPDLKANTNMLQLQEELTSTENKVAFSRQGYNDAVMTYNTARETFPNVIVAGFAGFTEARLFEIENVAEREAPKVSF